MWVIIFAFIAACITIFVAGLLVHKQRKCEDDRKKMEDVLLYTFDGIVDEVELLTYDEIPIRTLRYLEKRMDMFDKSISSIQIKHEYHSKYKRKGDRSAKYENKKYSTDD